jgi:nitroimidazol reductase NimA-like FMN-containing flavoprotein (pyridoxamine 5'-phosphate oxidase superfamily)
MQQEPLKLTPSNPEPTVATAPRTPERCGSPLPRVLCTPGMTDWCSWLGRTDVLIQDMSRDSSIILLKSADLGRIACARGSQPYVTPFTFAYNKDFMYSFGTVGKKIEWMRTNPLVCVEVDKIVSRQEWQTIVIFGRYQELPRTKELDEVRRFAHEILAKKANWWEPGFAKTLKDRVERPLETVFFRIMIDEISGHQAIPDADP